MVTDVVVFLVLLLVQPAKGHDVEVFLSRTLENSVSSCCLFEDFPFKVAHDCCTWHVLTGLPQDIGDATRNNFPFVCADR